MFINFVSELRKIFSTFHSLSIWFCQRGTYQSVTFDTSEFSQLYRWNMYLLKICNIWRLLAIGSVLYVSSCQLRVARRARRRLSSVTASDVTDKQAQTQTNSHRHRHSHRQAVELGEIQWEGKLGCVRNWSQPEEEVPIWTSWRQCENCSSQPSMVQWLSSSIFPCLIVRPAVITPEEISTFSIYTGIKAQIQHSTT